MPESIIPVRLADRIFERLSKEADAVFYVPGGGAMFLVDALGRSGLSAISAIHEQGAGAMAIGYAMLTGRLGICLVTSGPGATNAITPCLAALMDSVPVLFISGQARSESLIGITGVRSRGVQEAQIIPMVRGITKMAVELWDEHGMDILDNMIIECKAGRAGPCWLSVPQDIQALHV